MNLTHTIRTRIRLFITGFCMGAADIVPGVSGGTIAFLMGIYEELIQSIKTTTGDCLRLAFIKRDIVAAWKKVPFEFLVPLGLGLMTAVFTLAQTLDTLLTTHPVYVWSFFLGLIVASIWLVRTRVKTWDSHDYFALFITTVFTYWLVGLVPTHTSSHPLMIMASGAIAICAMILPGISGSFLLVIMGKYEQILEAVVQKDIWTISIFMVGIIIGISIFARVLSWLFMRHHDITIAALIGFMIGSLRKVWPWKEVLTTRIDSHGLAVPLTDQNILPPSYGEEFWLAIVCMIAGYVLMIVFEKLQVTKEHTTDIHDNEFAKDQRHAVKTQKHGVV